MSTLGDGKAGFFEGRGFDIFRGPEGRAFAAADRADEAVEKAELKAVRAGLEDSDLDADDAPVDAVGVAVVQSGSGQKAELIDRRGRKQGRAHKQAIRKLRDQLTELMERQQRLERWARGMEGIRQDIGGGLDSMLDVASRLVAGINAADVPTYPMGLQIAAAVDVLGGMLAKSATASYVLKLVGAGARIWAFWDPRKGLPSIVTAQTQAERIAAVRGGGGGGGYGGGSNGTGGMNAPSL